MKTKHKILSVLIILALVVTMFVVVAPTASAAPAIVLAPTAAGGNVFVGDTVIITDGLAADFLASTTLTVLWGKTAYGQSLASVVTTTPATVTSSATGTIPGFSFAVPAGTGITAGTSYTVWVTDGVNTGSAVLNVVPKLKLSSTSVASGTTITATGSGFAATVGVQLKLFTDANANKIQDGVEAIGATIASGTTDSTGSFTTTFVASAATAGTIMAVDLSAGANQNVLNTAAAGGVSLALKAAFTMNPTHGLPGATITASLTDYSGGAATIKANAPASIKVGAIGVVAGNIPAEVVWSGTTGTIAFTIPVTTPSGVNQVTITDSGAKTATANFTVDQRPLTLTPSSGPRGTSVTVTGTQLTPSTVTTPALNSFLVGGVGAAGGGLTLAGANWNTGVAPQPGNIGIDTGGNIVPATLVVPAVTAIGANTVVATDFVVTVPANGSIGAALTAVGTFTVTVPTITVSPASGPVGTVITVTGAGWAPGANVTIALGTATAVGTPDASGNFTATVTANSTAAVGANNVTANDGAVGNVAVPAVFTRPAAAVSVNMASAYAGQTVTVSGTSFLATTPTTISIGGYTYPTQAITDNLGSFSYQAVIPGLGLGAQVVTANQGGVVQAAGTLTIVAAPVTPPAPPAPATAFASVSTQLVRVWFFDGPTQTWKLFDPAAPTVSDLTVISNGNGYWVNVKANCTLTFGTGTKALYAGWNLIGWPPQS